MTVKSQKLFEEVRMRQYHSTNLIVHPSGAESDVVVEVTPDLAGWDYIHFQVRRLQPGHSWRFATGEHELALVMLSGRIAVDSNLGHWPPLANARMSFQGRRLRCSYRGALRWWPRPWMPASSRLRGLQPTATTHPS